MEDEILLRAKKTAKENTLELIRSAQEDPETFLRLLRISEMSKIEFTELLKRIENAYFALARRKYELKEEIMRVEIPSSSSNEGGEGA